MIPWDEVGESEGTGIVHIAPAAARKTSSWAANINLPLVAPLNEEGDFIDGFGWLTGKHVSEVAEPIFDNLREKGLLYRVEITPTATPPAGAARPSWSSAWWTSGLSAWGRSTTSRAAN